MKQSSELIPIIAFLIALWLKDIYVATAVLMVATAIQMAALLVLKQPITKMQWIVAVMVFVFGALTLGLHDERFIKIKPSVAYGVTAIVFFVSEVFFKKNLVKSMLESALQPPEHEWRKLNYSWVGLFVAMAILNLIMAYYLPTEQWAMSKLGFIVLTFVFMGAQFYRLRQYMKEPS